MAQGDALNTVRINGLPNTAFTQGDATTAQAAIPATNLAMRKSISIKALAANAAAIYVGLTGVLATTGFELSAGDSIEIDADATVNLFIISASGTQRWCAAEIA